jgi:hypothetical protein
MAAVDDGKYTMQQIDCNHYYCISTSVELNITTNQPEKRWRVIMYCKKNEQMTPRAVAIAVETSLVTIKRCVFQKFKCPMCNL